MDEKRIREIVREEIAAAKVEVRSAEIKVIADKAVTAALAAYEHQLDRTFGARMARHNQRRR